MDLKQLKDYCRQMTENIEKVIVGKKDKIELVLAALLAGGHVLLEDVPGAGKTMLAKSLAKTIDADFKRIQFTPDLLPSDLLGLNFFNPKDGEFKFKKGALFTNILLADEINRATPRTQSSLLESMEERQITVDGVTYGLTKPYFVIATQNPVETQGTYPLPEAQLDRFMIRLSMGYPDSAEGVSIIKRFLNDNPMTELMPVLGTDILNDMSETVKTVKAHDDVIAYAVTLAEKTRSNTAVVLGVSARGALTLVRMAQAFAAVHGNGYITPDDIKTLMPYVFAHRIILRSGMRNRDENVREVLADTVNQTTAPTEKFEFEDKQ